MLAKGVTTKEKRNVFAKRGLSGLVAEIQKSPEEGYCPCGEQREGEGQKPEIRLAGEDGEREALLIGPQPVGRANGFLRPAERRKRHCPQ